MEIWKDIANYPGYQVSSHGNVRSFKKRVGPPDYWIITNKPQRILSPGCNGKYKQVHLNGSVHRVHRLVLETFLGPCPFGFEVCHNNGDAADNRIENLRYDSHAANISEAPHVKIPDNQVPLIRQRVKAGESSEAIAVEFSVSTITIRAICNGRSRKSCKGPIRRTAGTNGHLGIGQLTYHDAQNIRRAYRLGKTQTELSKQYNCSLSYICHIVHNRRLMIPSPPLYD